MHREKRLKYWARPNKYNAKRTQCLSEHWHNSKLEGRVCDELRLRKKAEEIKDYEIERTFHLMLESVPLGSYRADFVVTHQDGHIEIVEAKGMVFPKFKRDWEIMQRMYPEYEFTIVKR